MAILVENPANALIEHPEDLRTETPNADEMLCRDFFDDVWARGNDDRITDYLDDHFHWNAPPGYDDDIAGYARMVRDIHKAFPDLYADLDEVVCSDGKVSARWVMEGHHENDWLGIPATGNVVRMQGLVMDQIKDGRIASEFSLGDDVHMFAQLGVTDLSKFAAPGPARKGEPGEAGEPSMWQRLKRAVS